MPLIDRESKVVLRAYPRNQRGWFCHVELRSRASTSESKVIRARWAQDHCVLIMTCHLPCDVTFILKREMVTTWEKVIKGQSKLDVFCSSSLKKHFSTPQQSNIPFCRWGVAYMENKENLCIREYKFKFFLIILILWSNFLLS